MKFILQTSAFMSILAAIAPAIAAPSGPSSTDYPRAIPMEVVGDAISLTGRDKDVPTMYVCEDPEWSGRCVNMKAEIRTCYNLVDGLDGKISSAGPEKAITCSLFSRVNCEPSAHQLFIKWPGIPDMRDIGFDDAMLSFECFPTPI